MSVCVGCFLGRGLFLLPHRDMIRLARQNDKAAGARCLGDESQGLEVSCVRFNVYCWSVCLHCAVPEGAAAVAATASAEETAPAQAHCGKGRKEA